MVSYIHAKSHKILVHATREIYTQEMLEKHNFIEGTKDHFVGRPKFSSSSSVPGLRSSRFGVGQHEGRTQHRCVSGREVALKHTSIQNAPNKNRAHIPNIMSYHARLEL